MNGSQNPFGGNATPAASGPANGLAANKAAPNAAATPNPIIGFGSTMPVDAYGRNSNEKTPVTWGDFQRWWDNRGMIGSAY